MGACLSFTGGTKVEPETTLQRNVSTPDSQEYGIEKSRSCTDVFFLLVMAAFTFVLIVLLAYCMSFGDIYRILNGYDDCGNVCGHRNNPDDNIRCKGVDFTSQGYLLIQTSNVESSVHRQCSATCNTDAGYKAILNRCIQSTANTGQDESVFSKTGLKNFFQEVSEDLHMCSWEIVYLCIIAFVFSIIILFLFRFVAAFVVWLVLVGVVLASIIGTIFLWVIYDQSKQAEDNEFSKRKTTSFLVYAIVATIATICICLVILVLRKRIKLVIQLFREAGKAVASMPLLLAEPIITFIALAIMIGLWIYFGIWIESSGNIIIEGNQSAKYVKDSTMYVTRWYNLLALFWFSQFIIGCQHMIIAGAVATWFFTRNKSKVDSPISTSFKNLTRYHLGTVAFGSFIIALVQLIRAIFKSIEYGLRDPSNKLTQCLFSCCQCCLSCFEKFLQYLTRNAYIETAMNGTSFCTSGQKAFSVLASNALRVFAINSVGDFVLLLGKALVVLCTVLIGMELIQKKEAVHYAWIPLALAGIFAYLISHCFITVYEMVIDTIFLCFCEDCERNDGISRPYYMSRGLMEFVQNSKKVLDIHDRGSGKAWSENITPRPVKTVSDTVD